MVGWSLQSWILILIILALWLSINSWDITIFWMETNIVPTQTSTTPSPSTSLHTSSTSHTSSFPSSSNPSKGMIIRDEKIKELKSAKAHNLLLWSYWKSRARTHIEEIEKNVYFLPLRKNLYFVFSWGQIAGSFLFNITLHINAFNTTAVEHVGVPTPVPLLSGIHVGVYSEPRSSNCIALYTIYKRRFATDDYNSNRGANLFGSSTDSRSSSQRYKYIIRRELMCYIYMLSVVALILYSYLIHLYMLSVVAFYKNNNNNGFILI